MILGWSLFLAFPGDPSIASSVLCYISTMETSPVSVNIVGQDAGSTLDLNVQVIINWQI